MCQHPFTFKETYLLPDRDWLLPVICLHMDIKKTYQFRIIERRGRFYAAKLILLFLSNKFSRIKLSIRAE